MSQQALENVFQEWQNNEALAEQMIPLVGQLYRQNNVVATMFGRSLIKRSVIRILKDHRFVRKIEGTELSVEDTYPIVKAMSEMNLGPAHVDVGKLAVSFKRQGGGDLDAFLRHELGEIIDGFQPGGNKGVVMWRKTWRSVPVCCAATRFMARLMAPSPWMLTRVR